MQSEEPHYICSTADLINHVQIAHHQNILTQKSLLFLQISPNYVKIIRTKFQNFWDFFCSQKVCPIVGEKHDTLHKILHCFHQILSRMCVRYIINKILPCTVIYFALGHCHIALASSGNMTVSSGKINHSTRQYFLNIYFSYLIILQ